MAQVSSDSRLSVSPALFSISPALRSSDATGLLLARLSHTNKNPNKQRAEGREEWDTITGLHVNHI